MRFRLLLATLAAGALLVLGLSSPPGPAAADPNGPAATPSAARPFPKASTGTITRISVASDGRQGFAHSWSGPLSADGRYAAFISIDPIIWPRPPGLLGDTPARVLVRDRQTRRTTLAAFEGCDSWSPSISADGRYVAFHYVLFGCGPGSIGGYRLGNVSVRDRGTGRAILVSAAPDGSPANGNSSSPSISADGQYVAFQSNATNLVGGDTNGKWDIFVRDLKSAQVTRASVAPGGIPANDNSSSPSISADGRYVAFVSAASNLVAGDANAKPDIFVYDRKTTETTLVSVASDGARANGPSSSPSTSADGRYVAFQSEAANLVAGDTNGKSDIFVRDLHARRTLRVSVASDGAQANGNSYSPSISANGRYVAFGSDATNLVPGDTNGTGDAFVYDRNTGHTTRVSVASDGNQANGVSSRPFISADGRDVAFQSDARGLVPEDTNQARDVFIREGGF